MSRLKIALLGRDFAWCGGLDFLRMVANGLLAKRKSHSVKDDVFRFFPYAEAHVFRLPFTPNPIPQWFETSATDAAERYHLPERFFLISNQFWVHKDHFTAFKALASVEAYIVCTGKVEGLP